MVLEMAWGNRGGLMALFTKVSGNSARRMVTESFTTPMVIYMREIGWMTKQTERAPTRMPTEQSMSVSGKMTNSMDLVLKPGLMVLFTKANIRKVRNTEAVN